MIPRLVGTIVPLDIPVVLGRDEARRRAAEELAKAKYGGIPDWYQNLLRAIREFYLRLGDLLSGRATDSSGTSPVVVVVVVALLLAIVVIVWRVGLPRLSKRSAKGGVEIDSTRSPNSYREQADAAAAAGDFRSAVGDRFRAVVREFEERTILDPRPARTATEVAVTAGVVLIVQRQPLDRLAALFNDTWYGDRGADRAAYAELCELDGVLTAAADRADLSGEVGVGPEPAAGAGAGTGHRR